MFGVRDSSAGRHDLNLAMPNQLRIPHSVLMTQRTSKRYGYDLHVAMGMRAKTEAGLDDVVIDDPERTEAHATLIVVSGE